MGVRRLVRAGPDAVTNGMRRLPLVAGGGDAVADQEIQLRERGAWATVVDRSLVDLEQLLLQLGVLAA